MVIFDNSWMILHVKSMGKLHLVERLYKNGNDHNKGFVEVAQLNKRPVMAKAYPAKQIVSTKLKTNSLTGFFIKSDDKFFGVCLVTNDQKKANDHMIKDVNSAIIATDSYGYHYIATTAEVI